MSRDIEDGPDLHQGPVLFVSGSFRSAWWLSVAVVSLGGVDGQGADDFAGGALCQPDCGDRPTMSPRRNTVTGPSSLTAITTAVGSSKL